MQRQQRASATFISVRVLLLALGAGIFAGRLRTCPTCAQEASYEEIQSVATEITAAGITDQSLPLLEAELDPGWWTSHVPTPLSNDENPIELSLELAIIEALSHSEQIRVFSELPLIRETAVIEASAAFDWTHYINTRFDDVSEPIGNALTAGAGVTRFNDHRLTGLSGLRRRTLSGGTVDVSQ